MSLLYASEAFVLSVLCWAWIVVRDLIPTRPLLEDACVYAFLIVSMLHLAMCMIFRDQMIEASKAFFAFALTIWTYLFYAIFDGIDIWDTGSYLIPDDPHDCCPNLDVQGMNRAFYFGDSSFWLASSGITFALITVLTMVAGAALAANAAQGSMWPGNGWGYSCASVLSMVYALRYLGYPATPCPSNVFLFIFNSSMSYGYLFTIFSALFVVLIIVDGVKFTSLTVQEITRVIGLIVVVLFSVSICLASDGRGMLIWGVIEPFVPQSEPAQLTNKIRRRWVMPMSSLQMPDVGIRISDADKKMV
jgi:uncharacterized membrane protein